MQDKIVPWASEEEYKRFEKEYKETERGKSCNGCIHDRTMKHPDKTIRSSMCGLASSLCVNSPSKPYYRSEDKEVEIVPL